MRNLKVLALQALAMSMAFLLLFAAIPNALSLNGVQAQEVAPEIRLDYAFASPVIESGLQDYKLVAIPGLSNYSVPGKPVVPFKTAKILVPCGEEVENIEVIPGDMAYLGEFYLQPGQKPVPIIDGEEPKLTPPDETVYGSMEPYPKEPFSEAMIQWQCGYQILILNLYPVQYIPKARRVSYFQDFEVVVSTRPAKLIEKSLLRGLPQDRELVATIADNSGELETYDSKLHASAAPLQAYDYLIITSEALAGAPAPNFQTLQAHKNAKGVATQIQTVEWIYANVAGADNQEKIRNYIRNEYLNHGITYVLLGGDADGADVGDESGDNIVPVRGLWAGDSECDPPNIPSDLYYACLDGDYDYNGNGIYGEPTDGAGGGEVDLEAEVYVGRAPVDSAEELANFVNKTIAYESAASDSYLTEVWMVGENLGWVPWGGDYKDEIKDGSSSHGYTTAGIPDCYNKSTLYDCDYPGNDWPKSEIINAINSNIHIINHWGHAKNNSVMKMLNDDVDVLTNTKYFFGYSTGCYAGSFDNREPPSEISDCGYLDKDCIVEHFVAEAHGAFAFIAPSRFGWGNTLCTRGPSQHYDREFWDAIFGEDITNIGKANQDSKEDNIGYVVGSSEMRFCYYEINLLGDPETPILPPANVPDISVSPTGFSVSLSGGTTWNDTLEIGNSGGSALTYNITDTETTLPPTWAGGEISTPELMETIEHEHLIELKPSESMSLLSSLAIPNEIAYDDGRVDSFWIWNYACNMFAVRFTPPEYPADLDTAGVCLWPEWPDSDHEPFAVAIYDDDGPSGAPGTLLGSVTTTATDWGLSAVDMSTLGITITDGDFYIAYHQLTNSPDCEGLCIDETAPDGRSWLRVGGDWYQLPYPPPPDEVIPAGDWMIRCVVDLPGPSDCPWLGESPASGSVVPGNSDMITVSIDTAGLDAGDYSANIVISNNDPDENLTIVPVNLTVVAPQKLIGADDAVCSGPWLGSYFFLQRFQAVDTGDVISFRFKATGSGNARVAIYADNSGEPGALLNAVDSSTPVTAGWNDITITSTPVGKDNYYWLALNSDAAILCYQSAPGGVIRYKLAPYASFTFPNPAGGGLSPYTGLVGILSGWGFTIPPGPPTVTNASGATNVMPTSATLNGEITDTGGEDPSVIIYWGTADGGTTPGSWANNVDLGTMPAGTFSTGISGLSADTAYFYRCFASNSNGEDWADSTAEFTTPPPPNSPTVTNASGATNVMPTSATLNGEITDTGGEDPSVIIYWGPADGGTTPGNWANNVDLGIMPAGTFSTGISGLSVNTDYFYRCFASNSGGEDWADSTAEFTTPATPQKLIGADDTACSGSWPGSYFLLQRFQAVDTGDVISFRFKATGSGNARVAIYADNSGEPGALLNAVDSSTPVTAGWNDITITSTPVVQDNYYWLALNSDAAILCYQSAPGGVIRYKLAPYASFTFPNPAGGGLSPYTGLVGILSGWGITVPPTPPEPPTLLSPGAIITFEWNASSGATKYWLQVNLNSSFTGTSIFDAELGNVTSQAVDGLTLGTTYYWRVKAGNDAGWSDWSSVRSVVANEVY